MSPIQLKLIASLTGLVVVVVGITGILAEHNLRARELTRISESLIERARLAGVVVRAEDRVEVSPEAWSALAREVSQAARARVTLVDSQGDVLADSEIEVDGLASVENHRDRPEIRNALSGRVGQSTRWSATVGRPLLYIAVPLTEPAAKNVAAHGSSGAVIRLAVDLEDVDEAAADLRGELLIAGAIGLIAAGLFSVFISGVTLRPVTELREFVSALATGRINRRLRWTRDDELGEIARSINDIIEHNLAQLEDATADRDQLELVLSSMVEGVLVIDHTNRIALANPRAKELFEPTGPVEGQPPENLIRDPRIEEALAEATLARQPVVREFELDRTLPRVLLMTALRFSRPGSPSGTVAVFRDVTDIRHLERMRRDFIANASHELRTPLTPIKGFTETLLRSADVADRDRPQLESIARNAARMESLIDDLLALSRIENRDTPMHSDVVDLAALARTLARDMAPRLEEKNISIEIRSSDSCLVQGDERAIEQILSNLLENAARYTDDGGRIRFSAQAHESRVEACVEDSGIGIPEADLPHIFERFYRVDKARSRAKGGTGLGLAIVKHWLQALGGTIRVESELERGSRFYFTLPRAETLQAAPPNGHERDGREE